MKRRKSRGEKKPSAVDTSPEALADTWKIVEEELKASRFQVSVKIYLKVGAGSICPPVRIHFIFTERLSEGRLCTFCMHHRKGKAIVHNKLIHN